MIYDIDVAHFESPALVIQDSHRPRRFIFFPCPVPQFEDGESQSWAVRHEMLVDGPFFFFVVKVSVRVLGIWLTFSTGDELQLGADHGCANSPKRSVAF